MSATPACLIGHITIKNAARWDEYRGKVPATLTPWNAELLFRGRLCETFSGEHAHTDTVVIRFPDADAMRGWFRSPAYQALLPLRAEAAEVTLLGFE